MRAGTQHWSSVQQRRKQDKNSAAEKRIQDQPQKCIKMLMRRIHGGFNEVGSEASSDEEEEEDSEDADDDADHHPPPSSVINTSAHNKKRQRNELFHVLLDSETLGCLATAEAVKRAGIKQQTATKPKSCRTAAGRFHTRHFVRAHQHRILELNSKRKLQ